MKNDERFEMRIPGPLKKRLSEIAKKEGRTLSNLILHILNKFIAGR